MANPTITDVSTDEIYQDEDINVPITGTNFETPKGNGKVEMADALRSYFFEEFFEGTGYDETGWNPSGTIDPDADPADAGSPSNWGTKCFEIIHTEGSSSYTYNLFGETNIVIGEAEVVITSEGLANDEAGTIFSLITSVGGPTLSLSVYQDDSGDLRFNAYSYHDGSVNDYTSLNIISLNTRYRIEVKWDATNNTWFWKIDGVMQPNDQGSSSDGLLTSTHPIAGGVFLGASSDTDQDTYTAYVDRVRLSSTLVERIEQTVTSWGATSIEFTADLGGQSTGTKYIYVRNDGDDENATGFQVTVNAASIGGIIILRRRIEGI